MIIEEELDFSRFKYPIHTISTEERVVELYNDLRAHKQALYPEEGWPLGIDKEKFLRYVIYMYSPGSPALSIEMMGERRLWCLGKAGFEMYPTGKFPTKIEEMIQGKIPETNRVIVIFLYLQNKPKFSFLMILEQNYYNLLSKLKTGDTGVLKEIQTVEEKMNKAKEAFLQSEEIPGLEQTLYRFADNFRLGLRPEEYVKEYVENGDVFPDIQIGI